MFEFVEGGRVVDGAPRLKAAAEAAAAAAVEGLKKKGRWGILGGGK